MPTVSPRGIAAVAIAVALGGFGAVCPRAHAHTTETITSITITNNTGFVIDSDATNAAAGFNRDALRVAVEINYETTNDVANPTSFYYELRAQLLTQAGAVTPICDENGQSGTVYTVTNCISLPDTATMVSNIVVTNEVVIKPAVTLDPYTRYQVQAALFESPTTNGPYVATGDTNITPPQIFIHFTNTNSSDSALNIIAQAFSATFTQSFAVATIGGQESFKADLLYRTFRYDAFGSAAGATNVSFELCYELRESSTSNAVPLATNRAIVIRAIDSHDGLGSPTPPSIQLWTNTVTIAPTGQLDSVADTYDLLWSVKHVDDPGGPTNESNASLALNERLLHFNGTLMFGDIETVFSCITNEPAMIAMGATNIDTSLAVDTNCGVLVGKPAYTYGDGTELQVGLLANGNAFIDTGSVALNGPMPDSDSVQNIKFVRVGGISLDNAGAQSSMLLKWPIGSGYRSNLNSRIVFDEYTWTALPLGQDLLPLTDPVHPGPMYAFEETKPVWIEASSMLWDVAAGRLLLTTTDALYVRAPEFAILNAAPVPAEMKIKRSNEGVFQFVDSFSNSAAILAADTSCTARLTADLNFSNGSFRAHFPYDAEVTWTGTGVASIQEDLIAEGPSVLNGASATTPYNRDCDSPDCGPGAGTTSHALTPTNNTLCFTTDGGLHASGTVTTATLQWGWINEPSILDYAHEAGTFTDANFHMAGSFLRGDLTTQATNDRPATLLYTGVKPLERPGMAGYVDGYGDYPGLNFRVGADGAANGDSVIGGTATGPYPLTGRSKYYIRNCGVFGIHEAVFGSFPATATIWGYNFNVSNFGLNFICSQNDESRFEGSIDIPYPSDFNQNFEEMTLNCIGAPDALEIPDSEAGTNKVLVYWAADFTPLAIDFEQDEGAACNPGEGFFVAGVQSYAQHISTPLHGKLGFTSNGTILARADGINDLYGHLKGPNSFELDGPDGEVYSCLLVHDLHLNKHDASIAQGHINIPVSVDVPFFENLQVHLQDSADKDGSSAPVYAMGGFTDPNLCFLGSSNYFLENPANPHNLGWPLGITLDDYHNGDTGGSHEYLVRAQRNWLGVVDLDYPLRWSPVTRSFTAFDSIKNDLLVLQVEHECKYLSADNAELRFGATYDGLPQINLANMGFEAIGLDSLGSNSVEAIVDGLGANEFLSTVANDIFDTAFDGVIEPVVCDVYDALSNAFDGVTWTNDPATLVSNYIRGLGPVQVVNSLSNRLANIMGAGPDVLGLLKDVNDKLCEVTNGLTVVENLAKGTAKGTDTIIADLVRETVGDLAAELIGFVGEALVQAALDELGPEFTTIADTAAELRTQVVAVKSKLQEGQEIAQELNDAIFSVPAALEGVVTQIEAVVIGFVTNIDISIDNPVTDYSPEEIKGFIRQAAEDAFFESVIVANVQEILKQRLYDLDAAIGTTTDSLFQQVNTVMRDLLNGALSGLDDTISDFLGGAADVMGAGKINGYAHINSDSLQLLRLDIYAQLNVPDEMEFNAYLQVKELDSEGTPTQCLPASGKATEVSAGAVDVEIDWISPDLRATLEGKFTFDSATDPPTLANMGAGFELVGALEFETFAIDYLGASMSFGEFENYFSAAATLRFNSYSGSGGIAFGKFCSLDGFFWDPDIQAVLGDPPFSGAYVYGEVWIPISEVLLGIPASCLFEISAGVGAGAGFFVEGPTFVGKMLLGVHGEVLCIVTVGGEVKMIGVANPDGLRLKGTGSVWGEIGFCPFCLSFEKSLGLELVDGEWDYDF